MHAQVTARQTATCPDGQRFILLGGADAGVASPKLNVVLNFFEELKERVPVP